MIYLHSFLACIILPPSALNPPLYNHLHFISTTDITRMTLQYMGIVLPSSVRRGARVVNNSSRRFTADILGV